MLQHFVKLLCISALLTCSALFCLTRLVGAVASPVPTQTQTTTTTPTSSSCSLFETIPTTISLDAAKRLEADKQLRLQEDSARQQVRSKLDTSVSGTRSEWDEAKKSYYAKLRTRAVTDNQKKAVETFITTVDTLVAKRRSDMDKVRKKYRDSVDAFVRERRSNADSGLSPFNDAIKAAAVDSQAKCLKSPNDLLLITDELRGQLRSIQTTYKTSIKSTDLSKTLLSITNDRQDAIKKIDNDFKAAEEAARVKLREQLGEGA